MTIPRSDNPTPIDFDDIRVGDTVERQELRYGVERTARFVVSEIGHESNRILLHVGGFAGQHYLPDGDRVRWLIHHRSVVLPEAPTFGRLTWTKSGGGFHSVVAEWQQATRSGAMSSLGHGIPSALITKWEPGEFVPTDVLDTLAAAVQSDEARITTRPDSRSTICLREFLRTVNR